MSPVAEAFVKDAKPSVGTLGAVVSTLTTAADVAVAVLPALSEILNW